MFKEIFILLLLGHIAGDFYVQTDKISHMKENSVKWVAVHSCLYLGSVMLVCCVLSSIHMWTMAVLAALTHAAVDFGKFYYNKGKILSVQKQRTVFIIDQLLHISVLVIAAYFVAQKGAGLHINKFTENFFNTIEIPYWPAISWLTVLLLLHKPANIFITKVMSAYRPDKEMNEDNDKNAGRFIGTLERIIMVIFLSIQQYSAVGLVLTAKSIARYNKIAEKPSFAEYYLLGTLMSTLCAVIVSFLL